MDAKMDALINELTDQPADKNSHWCACHAAALLLIKQNARIIELEAQSGEPVGVTQLTTPFVSIFIDLPIGTKLYTHPAPVPADSEEVALLRGALKYYADRNHFMPGNEDQWDTVSGEPQNFLCDEEGLATIEDGSIAAQALKGVFYDEDGNYFASIETVPADKVRVQKLIIDALSETTDILDSLKTPQNMALLGLQIVANKVLIDVARGGS